jgi:hypothetical protein
MLSPTAAVLFHREMENEKARLKRDDPNYIPKLQAILQKETLLFAHQYGTQSAPMRAWLPRPVGSEDYGSNTSALLTPTEHTLARLKLAEWHSPQNFQNAVHVLHGRYRSREIFNDPKLSFLLDAWTLAEFACLQVGVQHVRLAGPNEQWPDGYISTHGEIQNIEATIALLPGRKMGDEYKFSEATRIDRVEDWIAAADALPAALEEAIARKVKKKYGSPVTLVVYVNISEYGIRQAQGRNAIADIKRKYAGSFADLHVLWKDELL